MKSRPAFLRRCLVAALLGVGCASLAHAQFESRSTRGNNLFQNGVPAPSSPALIGTQPQFSGVSSSSGSSSANNQNITGNTPTGTYPSAPNSGPMLQSSHFGNGFASGVPRYLFGEVITPPVLQYDGVTAASATYWRAEPVKPGEIFTQPQGGADASPPVASGTTPAFYYSRHAGRVFATQSGRVSVTWVTNAPQTITGDSNLRYRYKTEDFSVSTAASKATHTIYWTERGFNGPVLSVPAGKIETINPVYSANFPATVATEYQPVGVSNNNGDATELRTLWFEKTAGIGSVRAYNREGRLFIEYLGALKQGTSDTHEFLGADIVDVVRIAQTVNVNVALGQQITPRDLLGRLLPGDGTPEYVASPVLNTGQSGTSYYGTLARSDGKRNYYAERENEDADLVTFYWLQEADAGIHFLTAPASPKINLLWPVAKNAYLQRWPTNLTDYAHYTVGDPGSTVETGLLFPGNIIPQIVYQDDPTQTEASIDPATQRLKVAFNADGLNRSLLKFSTGNEVWYVPLYTQRESRSRYITVTNGGTGYTSVPTVTFTNGGDGATALATVVGNKVTSITIVNPGSNFTTGTQVVISGGGGTGATAAINDPGFQEGDTLAAINSSAYVGTRIEAPAGYEKGGYIASGTGYNPEAYANPFSTGVDSAGLGAIIPVNAVPGANELKVWWFKKVNPVSSTFTSFYVPAKIGHYTVSYPSSPSKIILASNSGSGDLSPAEIAGSLYVQNDRWKPGFNPNEEHAIMRAGRVYALRDDLNNLIDDDLAVHLTAYTSEAYALVSYTSSVDGRPAMHAFKVEREAPGANQIFDYPVTAGTILQGPMPLPLLPLPVDAKGNVLNVEITAAIPDPSPYGPATYSGFTFKDRKGYHWIYRGPHNGGTPALAMRFYYTMQEGFFVPGLAVQPAVGTVLPYLRPIASGMAQGDPVTGTPLTILYRPQWPVRAPELRVGETLTLPKFGLPAVLNQASAVVYYQQSIALNDPTAGLKPSVSLHDPIREKTFALGGALSALPKSILTTISNGKTYFQDLPPHLQSRFFYDPLRGTKGALVLKGTFVDEVAGEDYVFLNVLSDDDKAALLALLPETDTANLAAWTAAINGLSTAVETFIEDPARAGTFIVGSTATVGAAQSAAISDSDTAVEDYALTATGQGDGYVTLVFGNGRAFTSASDPVSVQVIKVVPQLYTGELKVQAASNPLDEQVTLFHSGDFAARPQDYEFQWRYAPPQDGVAAPTYLYTTTEQTLGPWRFAALPAGTLPTAAEYALEDRTLPLAANINSAARTVPDASLPGLVVKATNTLTIAGEMPARFVFSAATTPLTGFVVYVNGAPAVAYQAPASFTATPSQTGLVSGGLSKQFSIDPNFFHFGSNTLEIALFSTADIGALSSIDFKLHKFEAQDRVLAGGSPWTAVNGLKNSAVVGGSPTAPLGSPLLVLTDNYFTMRYRPKTGTGSVAPRDIDTPTDYAWSRWMPPVLVEGWIKRVLAGINPFNQRMSDFNSNTVNTDVSLLTQAGQRWEGNVALTLDGVANAGLIEIYESLLNRAKAMSIGAHYDYPPANDALLLAAGYLNDLYTVLGNEAYADAANPTISIDDSTTVTEVNTSRFSFESQVSSVGDEELALLRGRDDFLAPGTVTAPAYNRLYWNYTRGINSGEALYAVNYNIQEKAGSPTANGVLDAADAQRMFPQGHGDAYGHYLTALTGYYQLLRHENFTWTPRSEAVTVLGRTVQVDYFDERKFATSAANLARTASQVLALTYRQSFKDDAAAGWTAFRDGKPNAATATARQWGLDEWASRATQGAYYNWVVGNAIVPDVDNHPQHTGVQVIDRTTITALSTLAGSLAEFQATLDSANAHLNPLGLSPGAIAFDISPAELKAGKTHYEQIYSRALQSVLNAKGAFDQAAKMTRSLRNQENQVFATNTSIVDQEGAYTNQLRELYGSPYTGDIGVGKTYAAGYTDFDQFNWFVIDRPSSLVDTTAPISVTVKVPTQVQAFSGFASANVATIAKAYTGSTVTKTVTLQPNRYAQFADAYPTAAGTTGARAVTGKLQFALMELYQSQIAFTAAKDALAAKTNEFLRKQQLNAEILRVKTEEAAVTKLSDAVLNGLTQARISLENTSRIMNGVADLTIGTAEAVKEFMPTVIGLANDTTSSARGAVVAAAVVGANITKTVSVDFDNRANSLNVNYDALERLLAQLKENYTFTYEQAQFVYEYELVYREVIQQHYTIAQLAGAYQVAAANFANLLAEGDRLQSDRAEFRQRAAAQIQGYRTKDLTFRTFRNEALEQYRSLFDLASRYTYLAAKSYDYETGLLGTTDGQAVIDKIVAARSLGDLSGGVPQATVSTLGDSGLAGTMARLQADWSVVKGRLGLNNPDLNGTLFSLRRELFRVLDDSTITDDDAQWQQMLESYVKSNVLSDPDVAAHALNLRKADGSAVPGIVIPFRSTVEQGTNFFGLPLAAGDHAFTSAAFSTKIYSAGIVLRGYVGMDVSTAGSPLAGTPASNASNALSATPYVYLIPAGTDYMRAPPLGDTNVIRAWAARDQALPLPFNLGNSAFSASQFYNANGTLSEQPWILRKHQPFRPVNDPQLFYSSIPAEFTSSRLVGRSAWNSSWKIVIPAYTLLKNEQDGLSRFVASVKDIELFLRTYSNSGN